jgi:hypothetical protein
MITWNGGHLEKYGRHFEFKVANGIVPKEWPCQFWCLYHNVNDCFTNLPG